MLIFERLLLYLQSLKRKISMLTEKDNGIGARWQRSQHRLEKLKQLKEKDILVCEGRKRDGKWIVLTKRINNYKQR